MGDPLGHHDHRAPLIHALEQREEPVEAISGAVDHRQAEHGGRQTGVALNGALYRDLVILVIEPAEDLLERADLGRRVGLELGSQCGVFA
jgi:hypothetical protein